MILLVFIIVFIFLFIITDFSQRFFFVILLAALGYMYYQKYQKQKKKNNNQSVYFDKVEKQLSGDKELNSSIYYIHKTPRNIKFIKQHESISKILYDMKFLEIYDTALYEQLVSHCEYFLKIHFKVMIGKYDFNLYYPVLVDTRNELLNLFKSIVLNVPNISTILEIPDINEYVNKRTRMMQGMTYKLLKLLCHKYNKPFKPPYNNDNSRSEQYALF